MHSPLCFVYAGQKDIDTQLVWDGIPTVREKKYRSIQSKGGRSPICSWDVECGLGYRLNSAPRKLAEGFLQSCQQDVLRYDDAQAYEPVHHL